MSADFDEFSLLGEEAEAFGITVVSPPVVSRTSVTVADGTTLSALVWGTGRPQLMLLHGGGLNAHTWDSTLLELGVPAVAIDLPGHGDSDWRDDADYSPTTNAVAVTEVFDALAIGPQVLVGQSLGGLTAIAVAASRPDRVSALVIIDVSPGLVTTGGNPVRAFLAGADSFESRDAIVDRALAFGIGPNRRAVERGVLLNTRDRDDGRVIFKHHLAQLSDESRTFDTDFTVMWPTLESVTAPIVLVRGRRGFLSDDVVAEFAARVPSARIVTVDSGHNVQEDIPVELAALLRTTLP